MTSAMRVCSVTCTHPMETKPSNNTQLKTRTIWDLLNEWTACLHYSREESQPFVDCSVTIICPSDACLLACAPTFSLTRSLTQSILARIRVLQCVMRREETRREQRHGTAAWYMFLNNNKNNNKAKCLSVKTTRAMTWWRTTTAQDFRSDRDTSDRLQRTNGTKQKQWGRENERISGP